MSTVAISYSQPVTLAGGGILDRHMLVEAQALAPHLVAADGAADRLAEWGLMPDAVIGDMDSLTDPKAWHARTRVVHLSEQDTTDFEKCLYATEAPLYVATGFTGRRVDHMLAVFHAMLRRPEKPVVVLGEEEAMAFVPQRGITLDLHPGAVVSLYPILPARGTISEGLQWDLAGLDLAPGQRIGTSNRAAAPRIHLGFDRPGILLMIERAYLGALAAALTQARRPWTTWTPEALG